MRPIKFRVFNKRTKKIYDVFQITYYTESSGGMHVTYLLKNAWGGGYTKVELSKEDSELMQFTGLHDKNGKEIYEGDIVFVVQLGINGIIEFDNERCSYSLNWINKILHPYTDVHNIQTKKEFEVIGNIYENPELLEEKE